MSRPASVCSLTARRHDRRPTPGTALRAAIRTRSRLASRTSQGPPHAAHLPPRPYNRDAANVCQALAPSWDGGPTGDPLTAGTQAISRATPGHPAAYQLERAGLMIVEQCPDRLRTFRIYERMSARAGGY